MANITPGQRLADLRRRKGRELGGRVTQREVAAVIGVERETVAAWETDRQTPEGQNLLKLARYYNVSAGYILGAEPEACVAEPTRRYGVPELNGDLDRRVSEILGDAELDPDEKSMLLLDVALVLRAEALRDRDRTARIEAEEAARRRTALTSPRRGQPPPIEPGTPTPVERPSDRGEEVA